MILPFLFSAIMLYRNLTFIFQIFSQREVQYLFIQMSFTELNFSGNADIPKYPIFMNTWPI